MVSTNEQVGNLISEIEAIASVTHCSCDSQPDPNSIKIMMEKIINFTCTAKMLLHS